MTETIDVLIVEDLPTDAELAEREIQRALHACRFRRVETREEYVAALEELQPAIIVSDFKLPHFDGLSALKLASERCPDVPFIILTGSMNEDTAVECMKAGAWDYVIKEHVKRLGPAVRSALELQRARMERKRAEHDREASETRYRRLFEAAKDGILILDADTGKIVDVNPFLLELTGYAHEDFLGKHLWEIGSFKDIAASRSSFADLKAQRYVRYDDLPLQARDGRKIDVEFVSNVYRADNQNVIQCNIRDTSVRKRAEKRIREQSATLNAILESTESPTFALDREYRYTAFNRAHAAVMKALYGVDIEVGTSLAEYQTVPEDWGTARRNLDRALRGETVLKSAISGDEGHSRSYFEVAHHPVRTDAGEVIGVSVFARNVTERKRAEDEVSFRNLILSTQQEASIDGILVVDVDGKIVSSNRRFAEMWGIPLDVLASKSDERALQWVMNKLADPERFIAGVKYLYAAPHDKSQDEIALKDGRTFDRYSAPMLAADGRAFGRVWYFRDITERKRAEAQLEDLSRFPAENPSPVIRTGPDGTVLYANPSAGPLLRFWGREPGQPLPAEWAGLVADAMATGERRDREVDCQGRCFVMSVCPIQTAGYANVYGHDITARKRAEGELRESEERFRILFEQAADSILMLDIVPEGIPVIRDANSATFRLLGYERHELIGQPMSFLEPEPDISQIVDERRGNILPGTGGVFEATHRCKDGTIREFECSAAEIQIGPNTFAISVERDITARKRAEEDLRNKTALLEAQANSTIDGILVVDGQGKKIFQNQRTVELWKIPRNIADDSDDQAQVQHVMRSTKYPERFVEQIAYLYGHPDETSRDELELVDGTVLDRYSAPVLGEDGRNYGRIWTFRDITARKREEEERRKLEEQLRASQKMEAIGSLAGGVAHDFNNLLSVILSFVGFALEAVPDGNPVRDDLLEVKKAGERAAALTRQLVAFSRKQVLQPVPLDLNQIATGVEKMLRRVLGEDIDLVQVLAPDLGLTLADPGQIEQVLMNLVVNARDAMPAGGALTIETSNVEVDEEYAARHVAVKPGSYVQLVVSDTGSGMDEQTKARLFEPFFTTKAKGKGTGLGLSTVYGIVKQSGGNIWVYSEQGQGTTFKIYLPREFAAKRRTSTSPPAARRSTGTETILVVEDEEALRNVARRTLDAAGYRVLIAADGEEAVLTGARHAGDIHLLATDVVMPRMSGKVLAQRLSRTRPTLKVLYMSGYTDDAIVHHGVLDAGTHFLGKPFTGADLVRKVREVLDGGVRALADGSDPAVEPDVEKQEQPLHEDAVRALAPDLLGKLREAVIAARYEDIVELVETIRITQPDVAARLRRMADLFDYDGMQNLLGESEEQPSGCAHLPRAGDE